VSATQAGWQVIARTAKGAHKDVNQDCHGWEPYASGTDIALAVADGHGSSAHPRSDVGAKIAVRAFLDTAGRFRASLRSGDPRKQVKLRAEEDLPRNVVREWQQQIGAHLNRHPPTGSGPGTEPGPVLYGSTLIGALITDRLLLGWQLGDGEFCIIGADGQLAAPLREPGGLGDETDSLCSSDAQRLVRTYWAAEPTAEPPAMIVLSTDGLSKSFVSFDSYLEFIEGVHRLLAAGSAAQVHEQLQGWLERASSFSGDDTTFLAAWRGLNDSQAA
jgi:serine/threonine protein phosphatase PrpC